MNFIDNGIIPGAHAHGKTHAIVDIFANEKGRWAGLVCGRPEWRLGAMLRRNNLESVCERMPST